MYDNEESPWGRGREIGSGQIEVMYTLVMT